MIIDKKISCLPRLNGDLSNPQRTIRIVRTQVRGELRIEMIDLVHTVRFTENQELSLIAFQAGRKPRWGSWVA